jgi:hypothetical protein
MKRIEKKLSDNIYIVSMVRFVLKYFSKNRENVLKL